MSWLSEWTNKAEALLVKLDQDAAQVLQNPEGLLSSNNVITHNNDPLEGSTSSLSEPVKDFSDSAKSQDIPIASSTSPGFNDKDLLPQQHRLGDQPSEYLSHENVIQTHFIVNSTKDQERSECDNDEAKSASIDSNSVLKTKESNPPRHVRNEQMSKKFTLQTSKTGQFSGKQLAGHRRMQSSRKRDNSLAHNYKIPEANDIKASIDRSLMEYQSQAQIYMAQINRHQGGAENSNSHATNSFYDSRPNVIRSVTTTNNVTSHELAQDWMPEDSMSIDFPDDGISREDIALRLLRQNLRGKSTFTMRTFYKRVSRLYNQISKIHFANQARHLCRRARVQVSNGAGRMSYYLRIYPQMRFLILGCCVMMTLFILYVLFLYQPSQSSTVQAQFEGPQQAIMGSTMDVSSSS